MRDDESEGVGEEEVARKRPCAVAEEEEEEEPVGIAWTRAGGVNLPDHDNVSESEDEDEESGLFCVCDGPPHGIVRPFCSPISSVSVD